MSRIIHNRPAASAILGLAILCAGCTDRLAPTAPTHMSAKAVDGANAQSGSGAIIIRDGIISSWFGGDPRDGLAVLVGYEVPISAVCADQNNTTSPGTGKGVITPTGRFPVETFSREANVVVFEYGAGIVVDPCVLVGAPVVATGTVKYTFRVSDLGDIYGLNLGGPGSTSIHETVEGIVDLTGGGQARLFGKVRTLWGPDNSLRFDEERVRLTPL